MTEDTWQYLIGWMVGMLGVVVGFGVGLLIVWRMRWFK